MSNPILIRNTTMGRRIGSITEEDAQQMVADGKARQISDKVYQEVAHDSAYATKVMKPAETSAETAHSPLLNEIDEVEKEETEEKTEGRRYGKKHHRD